MSVKFAFVLQVRICREKATGHVYAMKKLKKSEMLRRGQVYFYLTSQIVSLSSMYAIVVANWLLILLGRACKG